MSRKTGWIIGILFLFPSAVVAAHVEKYQYIKEEKGKLVQIDWQLEEKQGFTLRYHEADERTVTVTDHSYSTIKWVCTDPARQMDVIAERKKDRIYLKGQLAGEHVERTMEIDSAPWYQATSLSLRALVLSSNKKAEFWVLRPGTLKAYKLVATKGEIFTQPIIGKTVKIQQVHLCPEGILAPLWSCNYWFEKENGLLIKSESPIGPPGSPEVVVRLTQILQ